MSAPSGSLVLTRISATGGHYWETTTGSGSMVLSTSPTFTTPVLGVATATSINKVAITAPATSATLTIADGKTATISNTLTFTGTDASSVAFGTGGTVAYTANNLSVFATTTSAQLAGVISDETGSGLLVFATSPSLTTPNIGAATATSVNGLTINATTGVLTMANGSTLVTSGAFSTTLTATAATNVTLPTTGTLSTLAGSENLTNKTITTATLVTPTTSGDVTLGANIVGVTGTSHYFYTANGTGATASNHIGVLSGDAVSANSGNANLVSGTVTTAGNSGAVQMFSGDSSILGNSGRAIIYTGEVATGNSGDVQIHTGGVSVAGNSGTYTLTTGDAGFPGAASGGNSGSITLTVGTAKDIRGVIRNRGMVTGQFTAPSAKSTSTLLTASELRVGWMTANQAGGATASYQVPTGTNILAAFSGMAANDTFDFTIINISTVAAEDVYLTVNTDVTIVGCAAIQSNDAITSKSTGTFRFRYVSGVTFIAYRIS